MTPDRILFKACQTAGLGGIEILHPLDTFSLTTASRITLASELVVWSNFNPLASQQDVFRIPTRDKGRQNIVQAATLGSTMARWPLLSFTSQVEGLPLVVRTGELYPATEDIQPDNSTGAQAAGLPVLF